MTANLQHTRTKPRTEQAQTPKSVLVIYILCFDIV